MLAHLNSPKSHTYPTNYQRAMHNTCSVTISLSMQNVNYALCVFRWVFVEFHAHFCCLLHSPMNKGPHVSDLTLAAVQRSLNEATAVASRVGNVLFLTIRSQPACSASSLRRNIIYILLWYSTRRRKINSLTDEGCTAMHLARNYGCKAKCFPFTRRRCTPQLRSGLRITMMMSFGEAKRLSSRNRVRVS